MTSRLQGIGLEAVLADMPTPLVVLDTDAGTVAYANAAAIKIPFAYQDAPDWRATGSDGETVPLDDLPHREALRGEGCNRRLVHFQRGDEEHSLLFHCHALGSGLVVLTFDDVTSFDDVQRQLREALQTRDELVSMAAHELRSPLGALQLVAERLARKAHELDADEVKKLAETAQRQTARLNILVSNLLDVSRIRAGKFELELEEASLGDIVREACESLRESARAAGTALVVDIREACRGSWDQVRMEQVVVNLVTNALKYGQGTPIHVELERSSEHRCVLSVRDGGVGIPVEAHERVFEPFTRASSSHKAQSLGLGLFIVRNIVRAHGGDVGIESTPGNTAFSIELPIR